MTKDISVRGAAPKRRRVKERTASNTAAHEPQAAAFRLPAALDIRGARALKVDLSRLYDGRIPALLDASGVERLSVVAIQLLTAFFASMADRGQPARLLTPSVAMRSAAEDLGLTALLSRWEVGAA